VNVFRANRRELWVSMVVVVFGGEGASLVPVSFEGALIISAAMVIGLLCAVNAMLDRDRMGLIETYVAGLWLIVMLILTPLTLYWVGSIREFANK
jgi:hypothetical protein